LEEESTQAKKVVQSLIALDREEDTPEGYGGTVVRETNTGKMGLVINSEPCHALFAALLKRAYSLLELLQIPIVSIPAKLFLLIIKVPVTLPWEKFKKTLSYAG
jgi:hypothetical protein